MLSGQLAPPSMNELDNGWEFVPSDDDYARFSEYGQSMQHQENAFTKQQQMTTTTTATTKSSTQAQQQEKSTNKTTSSTTTTSSLRKREKNPKQAAATGGGSRSNDANGRSAALERAYVHDVYENCEESTGPLRPRIAQFLANLDPGSIVCDVGCGNGRYLTQCNPSICTIGVDRCRRLSKIAHDKGGEVTLCDNLELPFRNDSFDAVLSLAVIHHFATTERRVSAIRELARILRVGGRVIITVWALEQRHRRFESQDVLIPWQPPKNRSINNNYSDEEDDDNFLPPYHAYTEDSTNSSRSAGDGDSSSLSSSSPGESCYSFVRRAILKLAGGRKHPWFLDSWTSKDTKNDSSIDYEDAKDLPIELRRLEDFEDFIDPPLSAGLKSRSLGSILNPPPRQIVRSRSSVPILGDQMMTDVNISRQPAQFLALDGIFILPSKNDQSLSPTTVGENLMEHHNRSASNNSINIVSAKNFTATAPPTGASASNRRPKLIKQKQSLCDEDFPLPDNPFHMISNYSSSVNNSIYVRSGCYGNNSLNGHHQQHQQHSQYNSFPGTNDGRMGHRPNAKQLVDAKVLLRKQSSLNEELMAGNRIREKERIRKRIQKQMSLNETFLCRSVFTKRLQIIREGVASKLKISTGSLERATKNGFVKIMQNFKSQSFQETSTKSNDVGVNLQNGKIQPNSHQPHYHHHHHHIHQSNHLAQQHQSSHLYRASSIFFRQNTVPSKDGGAITKTVTYCNEVDCGSAACFCSAYDGSNCGNNNSANSSTNNNNNNTNVEDQLDKARRHSHESGSDSSKDSSLQSDTSIESEDSFVSVIFIPKPEQQQQLQRSYQQQHQNSNSSSSNSSGSNGGNNPANGNKNSENTTNNNFNHQHQHIASVPTSPLIMPCPPTPAHSPAAAISIATSPPQTIAAVTAAMAILTPPLQSTNNDDPTDINKTNIDDNNAIPLKTKLTDCSIQNHNRFTFDEEHIAKTQQRKQPQISNANSNSGSLSYDASSKIPLTENAKLFATKITRQAIRDLPLIPKFRKQSSAPLQHKNTFPIIRRCSATSIAPVISKLMSSELFNPATDDLDSDSSEPSSPDSIDSVISAPKKITSQSMENDSVTTTKTNNRNEIATTVGADLLTELDDIIKTKLQQQQNHKNDLKVNHITTSSEATFILNEDNKTCSPFVNHNSYISANRLSHHYHHHQQQQQQQDCKDFAEQLNTQLLRELEDKNIECRSLDSIVGDIGEFLDNQSSTTTSAIKKRNGEIRDLTALREELRERRLMLANLSTQPSLQQSSTSSSTSSLSSQTRSLTIQEEDEEEDEENEIDPNSSSSYSLNLYENIKISKFKYKRNRQYNLNPETAYLLQDDGDSSIRDDDDDDIEHDVILEEDEDEVAEELEKDDDDAEETNRNVIKYSVASESPIRLDSSEMDRETSSVILSGDNVQLDNSQSHRNQTLENRQSTESWEHSNSSTSLDSPSQGGAMTHHRYYHVFREGELDALINHHVTSLHIVSSHYERASWCIVAEKVQVWTI